MKIQPIGHRLYVKLNTVKECQSKGGVWLPDKHSEPSRVGTVVEIGDEVKRFVPGDTVAVSYFSGVVLHFQEIEDVGDGPDVHRIFVEDEILAKIG